LFDTLEYTLKIPNKEVKQSLNDYIIDKLVQDKRPIPTKTDIYKSLLEADLEQFKHALISMFAGIPYHNYTQNDLQHYEGFYASVIYVYLQSLGLNIIGEDVTHKGRIDLTIIMDRAIYILEFKVDRPDQPSNNALQQIKTKAYADKYLSAQKPIYLVGIHFDAEQKNLSQFEWEAVL
jgi:ATP-dependent exoDNAse (exonuclease V) beta subunit